MKKTVMLFALSFVLVAFLNAQNDCTGNSNVNTPKAKKEKPVNYSDFNSSSNAWDCVKPGKTDDLYMVDAFMGLMVNPATKPVQNWGHVVPNAGLKSGDATFNPDPGSVFSASGPKACCSPPVNMQRYNTVRDN